jgi:C4-dicarboxylate transporter DctQ subunit
VDVVINLVSPKARRVMAMVSVAACLVFAILLLIGSWNYWYPFATSRAFYETNDVPMPDFLQFFATWLNDGEPYEKLPRFIPYAALPLGMALLTLRFLEVAWKVIKGEQDTIIASHEAEDAIHEDPQHRSGEN